MARTARMITADEKLTDARKHDIAERVRAYTKRHGITLVQVGRELGVSESTVSEVLAHKYTGRADKHIRAVNNWMELDASRRNVVQNREFVEHSVAREIITVAEIVSETCGMGVVFGPARIGKSFTLGALEGSDRLGHPVLFTVGESNRTTPKALCELVCDKLDLGTSGTLASLTRKLTKRLVGTKRMLIFDESDACSYRCLEWIREIHDRTGCPVLLAGKPAIFAKLGFRRLGDFSEVTDQLAGRIVIRRDLTERTRRAHDPEPLFSADDINKLIKVASLQLKVADDAVRWLQSRACVIGMGGFGMAVIHLYLAHKIAFTSGSPEVTAEHLVGAQGALVDEEDIATIEEIVAASSGAAPIARLA